MKLIEEFIFKLCGLFVTTQLTTLNTIKFNMN